MNNLHQVMALAEKIGSLTYEKQGVVILHFFDDTQKSIKVLSVNLGLRFGNGKDVATITTFINDINQPTT